MYVFVQRQSHSRAVIGVIAAATLEQRNRRVEWCVCVCVCRELEGEFRKGPPNSCGQKADGIIMLYRLKPSHILTYRGSRHMYITMVNGFYVLLHHHPSPKMCMKLRTDEKDEKSIKKSQ